MAGQRLLDGTPRAGRPDHVCWVYDAPAALTTAARTFLADGLARGERLLCVGDGTIDEVLDGIRRTPGPLGDVDALIERGALAVLSLGDAYDPGGRFLPEQQLEFYDRATRGALADGFSGLRVMAEVTPLAADGARRPELVRWEHLADDFMARGSGMSAMCAYRRGTLDDEALADVGAVHPHVHASDGDPDVLAPFRVFFDGERLAVAGAVDAFGADRLRRVLASSPANRAAVVQLDLGGLDFVDVAGCRAVAAWARKRCDAGTRVELLAAPRLFRRMWSLLGFAEATAVALHGRTA